MTSSRQPAGGAGTLLFDLDGTLVDSLPDLTGAVNAVLAAAGLPPLDLERNRRYVGDGAKVMLERAFSAHGRTVPADGFALFLESYESSLTAQSRAFPGVPETLALLAAAGWRMAVCTNKIERLSRLMLEALGLAPFFAAVAGGDSFPEKKPDGRHLTRTLDLIGADPGSAVMIGDSSNDLLAARDARLPAVLVAWGYGVTEGLAADRLIERMDQLPDALSALLR